MWLSAVGFCGRQSAHSFNGNQQLANLQRYTLQGPPGTFQNVSSILKLSGEMWKTFQWLWKPTRYSQTFCANCVCLALILVLSSTISNHGRIILIYDGWCHSAYPPMSKFFSRWICYTCVIKNLWARRCKLKWAAKVVSLEAWRGNFVFEAPLRAKSHLKSVSQL